MDAELTKLLDRIKAARGTPEQWLEREMAVLHFMAALPASSRVFCRGEVRVQDKGHFPAVLTYNTVSRQTKAWAPSGRKSAMEAHHEALFWSNIPHASIAREVLYDGVTSVVAAA